MVPPPRLATSFHHCYHQVFEAMEAEHINRSDSDRKFTTNNYELTTTSSIEWKFSAAPESPPEGGFPREQKILRAQVRGSEALAPASRQRVTLCTSAEVCIGMSCDCSHMHST